MRDLLTDINGPESSENDLFNLANLEKELDAKSSIDNNGTPATPGKGDAPPPPGLSNLSAGAMVLGAPGMMSSPPPTAATSAAGTTGAPPDAFAASLQQFSALSLAEDFLKADSARKEQMNKGEMISNDLVNNLFEGEEDYDIKEDAILNTAGTDRAMAQLFPGFGKAGGLADTSPSATSASGSSTTVKTVPPPMGMPLPQQPPQTRPPPQMSGSNAGPPPRNMMPGAPLSHRSNIPPPPGTMPMPGGPVMPPPHMMRGPVPGPSGPMPLPPHMMRGPPGPGPGPGPGPHIMNMPPGAMHPGAMPPGAMPPPHVMMMMQQQMQMQQHAQVQQMHVQQQQLKEKEEQEKLRKEVANKKAEENNQVFKKTDFPTLGADAEQIEKERKEEEKKELERKKAAKNAAETSPARQGRQHLPVAIRYTFQNPSPTAPPVPATSLKCTSMTPRDLCYVLHSMLRPILSFASVLDAYNADYYRWSYDDRKSRNLLFLGGTAPSSGNNLPNPVWKETKIKAQEMEEQFRETVEKRADAWTKNKQTLGRVVKVNVKRPRALLSTTALTTTVESKVNTDGDAETEEDRQRTILWAARLAIDKGFQSYLNLVELRRLLQSRPGDALNGEESVINRREELLKDVQENVDKLHGAFGLKKVGDSDIECDDKILGRTLTLPKGRMLLSRVIDEGILPHPSACTVLPSAIKVVFASASTADLSGAPPAGEDRLLRSLTGLVKTTSPSVDPNNLLSCLNSTINAEDVINSEKRSMKSVLSSKRTLTELLFAVFSRGGEVCVGGFLAEWKDKESKFLTILSAS